MVRSSQVWTCSKAEPGDEVHGRCRESVPALGLGEVSMERFSGPNTEGGRGVHWESWTKEVKAERTEHVCSPGLGGLCWPQISLVGPGANSAPRASVCSFLYDRVGWGVPMTREGLTGLGPHFSALTSYCALAALPSRPVPFISFFSAPPLTWSYSMCLLGLA